MGKRNFGWHFTGDKLRDGSPLPRPMVWERYKGTLLMCRSGLHVGVTPWDALGYAPGDNLRLVEYAEVGEAQKDKIVCAKRRTIAQMDANELLRYFARMQAISCIDRWKQEPTDVVLDYLATGDDSLRETAHLDTLSAMHEVWQNDAVTVAWASSRHNALDAARNTSREAARNTALAAVWSVAMAVARAELNSLVYESFEGPMRDVGFDPCAHNPRG